MKIPYANCDFADIRKRGYFYVDKTPFLPHLEATSGNHVIFLRPRRFGKTTLISTLENYYDINLADRFDEIFDGLWIHENPTPNRNKYLVLTLDFSPVDTTGTIEKICTSFAVQVRAAVDGFAARYAKLVPGLSELDGVMWSDTEDMAALMTQLLKTLERAGKHLYLLIDEYDHFGNRLLADGRDDVYQELVKSTGFVRSFYASLKAFTRTSTIARTFITGVSPIMLDDLSSGFNIISHISQRKEFNALAGFTRTDVENALDTLLADKPHLALDPHVGDRQVLLTTLERHYDGYRFSPRAAERLYNSTLVLYFLAQLASEEVYPNNMLDLNVRTDYGRLYQIAKSTSEKETDTRTLLEEILTNESVRARLVEQFGTRLNLGREQVASLFYYMGMLTFAEDAPPTGEARLVIPNRVMRELQWEYMSFALMDHDHIRISVDDMLAAMRVMADKGEIQRLLDVFQEHVLKKLGLRETMTFNEQTMKLMLFAYMSLSRTFRLKTEVEMGQGYCDLLLGVPDARSSNKYSWIIEAKYVQAKATKAAIEKAIEQGYAQIDKYAADRDVVESLTLGRELKAGVLVFVGLKDVFFRPWPRPAKKAAAKKAAAKKAQRK
ncbi:MAG: AAA family ATPase [Polyangiaceae bacterium]|nr:AAA family ATPase [Polyangiaceae bacterium]